MKISIIGTGYVGSVTGVCLASFGNTVILIDIDIKKIEELNNCKIPFFEPGLEKLLADYSHNIHATDNSIKAVQDTEITLICVGTPSNPDGSINLDFIKQAAKEIGIALKEEDSYHTVIVKSTVLPGTTENIVIPIIEKYSLKKAFDQFGVACVPEFLKEGSAVNDFFFADRIVIGTDDGRTKEKIKELYAPLDRPKLFTSIKTAEMVKYVSNAFLATKISFANEIGNICKAVGVDSQEVFQGVGMDSRINPSFFGCGIGFGGSCFPKDLKALIHFSKSVGIRPLILDAVVETNELQPEKLIHLLRNHIDIQGKKIGVLGLSFKPDTDDVRESRAIPVIRSLLREGSEIIAYDPKAMENFRMIFPNITYAESPEEVLQADAILILTEWKEFESLDYKRKLVVDGRRISGIRNKAGIYEGICW
jgi:UDPglucose 6-dehydrogenase